MNIWSGVAPALVKAEIPAVLANQFTVRDDCAIAFSKHLYQSIVGGLPIEQAVAAGRIAAYNADTAGRDWGAAVLYLRASDGELFSGATESTVRDQAAAGAKAVLNVRTGNVAQSGQVLGAQVSGMSKGTLVVSVTTGAVAGNVTGVTSEHTTGGSIDANVQTGEVSGNVTGGVVSLN